MPCPGLGHWRWAHNSFSCPSRTIPPYVVTSPRYVAVRAGRCVGRSPADEQEARPRPTGVLGPEITGVEGRNPFELEGQAIFGASPHSRRRAQSTSPRNGNAARNPRGSSSDALRKASDASKPIALNPNSVGVLKWESTSPSGTAMRLGGTLAEHYRAFTRKRVALVDGIRRWWFTRRITELDRADGVPWMISRCQELVRIDDALDYLGYFQSGRLRVLS